MGLFQSHQATSREQVEKLREDFRKLSEKLNSHLNCAALARYGGVVLFIASAGFMLAKGTTLQPNGMESAIPLMVMGLILHIVNIVVRECIFICRAKQFTDQFLEIVPEYMDTSSVIKPKHDSLFCLLLLWHIFSFVACINASAGGVDGWLVFFGVTELLFNGGYLWKICREKTDINLKKTCQICIKTLDKVLSANEEP